MAQLLQFEVTCPICEDYFLDPVSIFCGHNFCRKCINFWVDESSDELYPCPVCRRLFWSGKVRAAKRVGVLTKLIQQHRALLEQRLTLKDQIRRFGVDVTLDADTAHPFLILSEDGKSVSHGSLKENCDPAAKRFDRSPFVLGSQSFTSGKHFWEVEVGEKTEWVVGVCKQSVNREGKVMLSTETGFWVFGLDRQNEYMVSTSPSSQLHVIESLFGVSIFLDLEAAEISFYNASNAKHIYTFTGIPTSEPLHPLFSPGRQIGSKNEAPLTIRPALCEG
ncbi:E3 ubiquitin-protein ligase TRIM39-like [Ornithorhynchus anatinus]|uniref:E3 ubiquitin-protein ligase TRIM39-like n=1 Tax=Ornithorhynchus anatinus TaxID=9258 RepID=UPI0019D43600|nr:E3 ubiquitin-protein ligase TRIM39-like [Ornithorhynchus anatinus]